MKPDNKLIKKWKQYKKAKEKGHKKMPKSMRYTEKSKGYKRKKRMSQSTRVTNKKYFTRDKNEKLGFVDFDTSNFKIDSQPDSFNNTACQCLRTKEDSQSQYDAILFPYLGSTLSYPKRRRKDPTELPVSKVDDGDIPKVKPALQQAQYRDMSIADTITNRIISFDWIQNNKKKMLRRRKAIKKIWIGADNVKEVFQKKKKKSKKEIQLEKILSLNHKNTFQYLNNQISELKKFEKTIKLKKTDLEIKSEKRRNQFQGFKKMMAFKRKKLAFELKVKQRNKQREKTKKILIYNLRRAKNMILAASLLQKGIQKK